MNCSTLFSNLNMYDLISVFLRDFKILPLYFYISCNISWTYLYILISFCLSSSYLSYSLAERCTLDLLIHQVHIFNSLKTEMSSKITYVYCGNILEFTHFLYYALPCYVSGFELFSEAPEDMF